MFKVRKITFADKEAVIEISKKIWEGDDYIYTVFDEWTADKKGEFAAVLYNDKIVGFGRYVFLTKTDVWLEGLRADSDAGIKGIGNALSGYFLKKLSRKKKLTSVRFSTYIENMASRTITERLGFRLLHTMSNKLFKLEDENQDKINITNGVSHYQPKIDYTGTCKTHPSEDDIYQYIESSAFLKDSCNLICFGWVCYPYSRQLIKKYFLKQKQYLVDVKDNVVRGLILYDTKANRIYKTCKLTFLSADTDEIALRLLDALKAISNIDSLEEIEMKAPDSTLNLLTKAEFTGWETEHDFLIYEYPLQKR